MTDAKISEKKSEVIARDWQSIDWCKNNHIVRDLRHRIYRASRQGNRRKVRSLQRLMLKCTANRELSIRKVTQQNKGRNTAGVDGKTVTTAAERSQLMVELSTYEPWKAQPVKRVFIPKANGKQRPLGIPTILDRSMQAVVKNALEPEWEAQQEPCSYGFRPGRSCHDAIARIYLISRPNKNKKWVVDADVTGAFDNIQHETVLDALRGFPGKRLIKAWLKAGIMQKQKWSQTEIGTPQGGVISPLLLNIALHGMEQAVGVKWRKHKHTSNLQGPRALVRYADDFIIFAESEADAHQAKADITHWLQERGLTLNEEKTRITHLKDGFNFLGFNVRHYPVTNTKTGWKLLIKPTPEAVHSFIHRLKQEWRALVGQNADRVVSKLNPILRGWGNYFRIGISQEIFTGIDNWMFQRECRWINHTHPNKGNRWKRKTYFGRRAEGRNDHWVFGGEQYYVLKLRWIPIQRHQMVVFDYSPDNPDLARYWNKRNQRKTYRLPTRRQRALAKRQQGRCPHCHDSLHNDEELQTHHIIPQAKGGQDIMRNLELVHRDCHRQKHYKAMHSA